MQRSGTAYEMGDQWPTFLAEPVVFPAKYDTASVKVYMYVCTTDVR